MERKTWRVHEREYFHVSAYVHMWYYEHVSLSSYMYVCEQQTTEWKGKQGLNVSQFNHSTGSKAAVIQC